MNNKNLLAIRIEDMTDDGRAFGRSEGLAVFVSGAIDGRCTGAVPGDLACAEITKTKKNSAEAKLVEITKASPDRIEAECPYFAECGGCSLQELSYNAQLKLKKKQLESKLSRLGGVENPTVNDCVGAETPKYYRNKAVFSVGPHGEVGFKKAKSNFVIDIEDCLLQSDAAMVCADALRTFLRLPAAKGLAAKVIKQMTIKTAFGSGEVMAVIESDKKDFDAIDTLVEMLDDAIYSLSANEEDLSDESEYSLESVALICNGKCRIIAGKPSITDEIITERGSSIKYEISPQAFYQVNQEQMQRLYDKAAEYAALQGGETVLDLYCGAGTIGIWLLDELRSRDEEAFNRTKVIGIESVKPAVLDANRNSVINNMINTRYIAGKAEEELPGMMGLAKLYKWNEVNKRVEREPEIKIDKADVVILDPPRAGCDEALLDAVIKSEAERIVYVSCDPGTLSRDLKKLCESSYEFVEATPVDQFPWTTSIESVSLLKRKG